MAVTGSSVVQRRPPTLGPTLALLCLSVVTGPPAFAAAAPRRAALIEFQGPIHTFSEQYLYRKLDEAQRRNADLVIIEIDSPGGAIEPTLRIAERLKDLGWCAPWPSSRVRP